MAHQKVKFSSRKIGALIKQAKISMIMTRDKGLGQHSTTKNHFNTKFLQPSKKRISLLRVYIRFLLLLPKENLIKQHQVFHRKDLEYKSYKRRVSFSGQQRTHKFPHQILFMVCLEGKRDLSVLDIYWKRIFI